MHFKENYLQAQFYGYGELEGLHPVIRKVVSALDWTMRAVHDYRITITCIFREGKGYHPLWRAVDIRTNDMDTEKLETALQYLTLLRRRTAAPGGDRSKRPQIEFEYEFDKFDDEKKQTKWQHIHLEYDNAAPKE